MILRLSQKLATRVKAGTLKTVPLDENPYADWSCHLFTAERTPYILVSNTRTLYSSVLYARGSTNDSLLIERVLGSLREFMEDDGQAFIYRKFVAPATGIVTFAKALNRSVTGSMTELVQFAEFRLREGDISPHDVGFELNDLLLSALGKEKGDYGTPKEALRLLADESGTAG